MSEIPKDAVLLIPEPEENSAPAPFGIAPGYYNRQQLLTLLNQHKNNAEAIYYIADMLETGDEESDGFARLLRTHHANPDEIARIVAESGEGESLATEEETNYFQKQLESDPDNCVLKILADMTSGKKRPFVPFMLPEIEDEDPVKLGRHGDCDVALEVLLTIYPSGIPHRLTKGGEDFTHLFLVHQGKAMDIGGYTTIETMQSWYNDTLLKPEPVEMSAVYKHFRGWRDSDEKRRLIQHFRKFIIENVGSRFPEPEVTTG